MDEVLTQREIDLLLPTGGRGTASSPVLDVRPYDFARPPRIPRERRAAVEAVHGRFAESLQSVLASALRASVDVSLAEIEQTTFGEFTMSIPSPCVVFPIRLGDRIAGQGVLELDPALAYFLVERMFGGAGDGPAPDRPLTTFEQSIVRNIAERFSSPLRDAWHPRLALTPELLGFEANPEMLQVAAREDVVLVTRIAVKADSFLGGLTVGLPIAAIEPGLRGRASAPARRVPEAGLEVGRGQILAGLQQSRVWVSARLPLVSLRAREIASLGVGQLIETGHPVDVPVEVHVNGNIRFVGSVGQLHRHVGLKISATVAPSTAQRPAKGRLGRVS